MGAVDPAFARWLQEGRIMAAAEDAGVQAAWGDLARSTDISSPLALEADAAAEAARQLAFLAGPLAIDEIVVVGLRADLWCRPITIKGDRLGYDAGVDAFVIGVEEADNGTTVLTVLRPLAQDS